MTESHIFYFNNINMNSFLSEFSNLSIVDYQLMFDFGFVVFGMTIIILALFFKLVLTLFHLWAPDVYEGSPTSSTFFFLAISKLSIFIFLRLCYLSCYSLISSWQFYFCNGGYY